MAYKQSSPIVRLIVLAVIVFAVWKYGVPWARERGLFDGTRPAVEEGPGSACVSAAADAAEAWSRGIVRFMNPPLDSGAWSGFRGEVEGKVDAARSSCSCQAESCAAASEAMRELSRVVAEMEAAARSGGPPPGDLVRAQETIDLRLDEAWRLARTGR